MDEGEGESLPDTRGPGEETVKTALRGANWNNGVDAGLFYLNLNNAPSSTSTGIGLRGIPFEDGMRDHGCGKTLRSTVHHPESRRKSSEK